MAEHSPAYDSKSNGFVERAVQTLEGQIRNLEAALEDRNGWKIPTTHAVVHWLLRHALYLNTKYHLGNDTSALARARGP